MCVQGPGNPMEGRRMGVGTHRWVGRDGGKNCERMGGKEGGEKKWKWVHPPGLAVPFQRGKKELWLAGVVCLEWKCVEKGGKGMPTGPAVVTSQRAGMGRRGGGGEKRRGWGEREWREKKRETLEGKKRKGKKMGERGVGRKGDGRVCGVG